MTDMAFNPQMMHQKAAGYLCRSLGRRANPMILWTWIFGLPVAGITYVLLSPLVQGNASIVLMVATLALLMAGEGARIERVLTPPDTFDGGATPLLIAKQALALAARACGDAPEAQSRILRLDRTERNGTFVLLIGGGMAAFLYGSSLLVVPFAGVLILRLWYATYLGALYAAMTPGLHIICYASAAPDSPSGAAVVDWVRRAEAAFSYLTPSSVADVAAPTLAGQVGDEEAALKEWFAESRPTSTGD